MKKLYFLALSVLASASLMATQVQVKADNDLQAAVNAANSGDTVLVQAGTYEGNFTMKDGVYVSGGWNEDFTAQTVDLKKTFSGNNKMQKPMVAC